MRDNQPLSSQIEKGGGEFLWMKRRLFIYIQEGFRL
jgi:hypothetical protein